MLHQIARTIRHAPLLGRAESLWAVVRKPYLAVLGAGGRGAKVRVGKAVTARVPVRYACADLDGYEVEAAAKTAEWLGRHPRALMLDVGASTGVYCLLSLYASPASEVIAFDPNPGSLNETKELTTYVRGGRLRFVQCLVSDAHEEGVTLESAEELTLERMREGSTDSAFVCIGDQADFPVPTYSLDGLFPELPPGRPVLVKCDIEGAEVLALDGMAGLIDRVKPVILLSVHRFHLPRYGHTVADVEARLRSHGYGWEVLSVDHEEHWWCQAGPAAGPRPPGE